MTSLDDILQYLRGIAPEESALPNDPVGLLIGAEGEVPITVAAVCLDAGLAAAQIASKAGAQLVIAHHPLIYHPLKRIDDKNDPVAAAVAHVVRSGMSLYAMHTNWDRAQGGINDTLAEALALEGIEPLTPDGVGALARIGRLRAPMAAAAFADFVAKRLSCAGTSAIRLNKPAASRKMVSRIAVCGGSGASLADQAAKAGADLFVTSDIRHDEFIAATAKGFPLIDAGHYATESPGMRTLLDLLKSQFREVEFVWCDTG